MASTAAVARAGAVAPAEYEEVLGRLSSLITQKVRAHSGNRGNQWDLMAHYVKVRARISFSTQVLILLQVSMNDRLIRFDLAATARRFWSWRSPSRG